MLRPWRRSKKYQFHSLWLDLIGAQTHDSTTLEASTLTITTDGYYKLDISLKLPSQLSFVSMSPVKNEKEFLNNEKQPDGKRYIA
jgi:hypothetical protein